MLVLQRLCKDRGFLPHYNLNKPLPIATGLCGVVRHGPSPLLSFNFERRTILPLPAHKAAALAQLLFLHRDRLSCPSAAPTQFIPPLHVLPVGRVSLPADEIQNLCLTLACLPRLLAAAEKSMCVLGGLLV